ncbi:cupin domain-containing protein [Hamadaea tsunoensis]|uniref:cupin domain-containing protein n=1 Tax=Hamadaea tsunoensis TaxID=53368 RepID=UPI00041A0155|nr:cupin domain-containing protein [Hamadaea tsunoensis]
MQITEPTGVRETTTAGGTMTTLASPALGSTELSMWRVLIPAGASGPNHAIDREQIWTVVSGAITVTAGGTAARVATGATVVLPAGELRQVTTDEQAEALVCMAVGGTASLADGQTGIPIPWAA